MKPWQILTLCMLAGLSTMLRAESAADSLFCRNGGFPGENPEFGTARVIGPQPAYFLDDADGCPRS